MAAISGGASTITKFNLEKGLLYMDRPRKEKWGITAELFPLLGGHRNTVLRTKVLGQNVVFKSTRRSPGAIGWLETAHDHARQAGFVVPYHIKTHDGNLIEDGWTCETFVEGQHIDQADLSDIQSKLVNFHDTTSGLAQRPGFLSSIELRHLWMGGDIDLNLMPKPLVRRCRDAWEAVSDRRESIIHGDLNVGNILRTPDGHLALVD
ncbi:MAG: phosphotransferase, partial [Lentilitoribacter sp.]